ncbi:MAG: SGNH/GDSL hydrolase family protein, partial [Bradyrhizobium sp.]
SVLAGLPIDASATLIGEGLRRLKAAGADVIVLDPQYAPEIIKNGASPMVDMIAQNARQANLNLFQRYELMHYWRQTQHIQFSTFLAPDELHMNDWGYDCVAKLLAGSINEAVIRPTVTAIARLRS